MIRTDMPAAVCRQMLHHSGCKPRRGLAELPEIPTAMNPQIRCTSTFDPQSLSTCHDMGNSRGIYDFQSFQKWRHLQRLKRWGPFDGHRTQEWGVKVGIWADVGSVEHRLTQAVLRPNPAANVLRAMRKTDQQFRRCRALGQGCIRKHDQGRCETRVSGNDPCCSAVILTTVKLPYRSNDGAGRRRTSPEIPMHNCPHAIFRQQDKTKMGTPANSQVKWCLAFAEIKFLKARIVNHIKAVQRYIMTDDFHGRGADTQRAPICVTSQT
jgi:hypothetical protein